MLGCKQQANFPREVRESYGEVGKLQTGQQRNIEKYGNTKKGIQPYRCKTCGKTFTETLVLLAEGVPVSVLARMKGHKEDTILQWVREAIQHAEQVEEALMAEFHLTREQLDALWRYVGNQGKKNVSESENPSFHI